MQQHEQRQQQQQQQHEGRSMQQQQQQQDQDQDGLAGALAPRPPSAPTLRPRSSFGQLPGGSAGSKSSSLPAPSAPGQRPPPSAALPAVSEILPALDTLGTMAGPQSAPSTRHGPSVTGLASVAGLASRGLSAEARCAAPSGRAPQQARLASLPAPHAPASKSKEA